MPRASFALRIARDGSGAGAWQVMNHMHALTGGSAGSGGWCRLSAAEHSHRQRLRVHAVPGRQARPCSPAGTVGKLCCKHRVRTGGYLRPQHSVIRAALRTARQHTAPKLRCIATTGRERSSRMILSGADPSPDHVSIRQEPHSARVGCRLALTRRSRRSSIPCWKWFWKRCSEGLHHCSIISACLGLLHTRAMSKLMCELDVWPCAGVRWPCHAVQWGRMSG